MHDEGQSVERRSQAVNTRGPTHKGGPPICMHTTSGSRHVLHAVHASQMCTSGFPRTVMPAGGSR